MDHYVWATIQPYSIVDDRKMICVDTMLPNIINFYT